MATPLIIGAALAGLLPLGALAGRSNKQIMDKLGMLPKRNQQLSKIRDVWNKSIIENDYEQSEIILDNFINLCITVIDNNVSKSDENINVELLHSLIKTMNNTFSGIPIDILQSDNRAELISDIKRKLDTLIDNYTKYILTKNKDDEYLNNKMASEPIEVYEYVKELLKLPFHLLISSMTTATITPCELMIDENIENKFLNMERIYSDTTSLLSTVFYCINKLTTIREYESKISTLINMIIESEKTYRDGLAKQAIALYPYYFDLERDKNTKLGEYLDVINVKINGLVGTSTLDDLGSILDDNNTLEQDDKTFYSKQFVSFINFVKNDLAQQGKENEKRLEIEKREKERAKKRKKRIDNEDDDLLLLMLIMELEEQLFT
jgi:hypothetical protein